jgi:uncharacterized DUF497 family protein
MGENLLFEWDDAKNEKPLRERGFDFDLASQIFRNEVVEAEDIRRDYGEARIRATGKVRDDFITVVYTWRGDRRRIISARPAKWRERDDYRKNFDA